MPKFSKRSLENLESCHEDLQELFLEVVQGYDCTILCGRRGKAAQDEAFRTGASEKEWPKSKHNAEDYEPSDAVDVAPYPIKWKNRKRFYHFAGYVQGIADRMGIEIRWGGDWDSDTDLDDQSFFDLPHFEIVKIV